MKRAVLLLTISAVAIVNVFADSPLTSTDIHQAYADVTIVNKALQKNKKAVFAYLADPQNPTDIKVAAVNALGWSIDGQSNADEFFVYLTKKHNQYQDLDDFITNANEGIVICWLYMLALDNYFDVGEAANIIVNSFSERNDLSDAAIIISHLIVSHYCMDLDWCKVYEVMDDIRNELVFNDIQFRRAALRIIYEYTDMYKEYCK